ncbi:MAG TPA: HAMP domain-containing sensor histidine kinase [Candidatus Saccharimonadia bacterium]|nr:HAMP domain-containing sensor histidine kinase [Candidatus Saccharimonadia bacterium]
MFHSARIKLTAWYLFIIMLISISFSIVVYGILSQEVDRFARLQRIRYERFQSDATGNEIVIPAPLPPTEMDQELIDASKQHIVNLLVITDIGILFFAGGVGYFLAGRTLQPIKAMVDEQRRFIGDASHELRTPLTALKSSMEVHLRDKNLEIKEARELIANNIVEVNRLQALSDSLLQLAQYEHPNNGYHFEHVNLKTLATEICAKLKPVTAKKHITLKNEVSSISIEAVPESLKELLIILLDNAVKYSPPKSEVVLQAKKTDGSVRISCADHGIGIEAKDLPHIFDRFYRADIARTTTQEAGYGLGLSIAKRVVRLHHGNITVESKPHLGTTFIVTLPVKQ